MSKTIHPGAFVQLTTGPYKAVLWGDEVNIPAFMVERIEGETVHCYYPPYSFEWPASDLVVVDRPAEYGRWVHGSLPDQENGGSAAFSRRLREAGTVLDYAPDLVDQVTAGDLALDAALQQAVRRQTLAQVSDFRHLLFGRKQPCRGEPLQSARSPWLTFPPQIRL